MSRLKKVMMNQTKWALFLMVSMGATITCSADSQPAPSDSLLTSFVAAIVRETIIVAGKVAVGLTKRSLEFLADQTKSKSKLTVLCGVLLACGGLYFLYRTVLSTILKILAGFALVGGGIAVVLLSGRLADEPAAHR